MSSSVPIFQLTCIYFCFSETVSIKWGKEKFENVELNTDDPPDVFKAQLFALSGVAPERQKVMLKGSVLKVRCEIIHC